MIGDKLPQTAEVGVKDLIAYMARALVDHPEKVQVVEIAGETTSVIELRVAKDDVGKVIGKQGHTANAIRTIVNAAAAKLKKRVVLEIVD